MGGFVWDPEGERKLLALADRAVALITHAVAEDARRGCPIDQGDLLRSIREDRAAGRVTVGTDHWAPTEYGSAPHVIRSRGPWPLRNAETGQVFGQEVMHPGTPQQAFMRPALYRRRTSW